MNVSSGVDNSFNKILGNYRFPISLENPITRMAAAFASVAHSAEHALGKGEVAGSNPARSSIESL